MFQRELTVQPYTCPTCGSKLTSNHGLMCCMEHGSFSAYGPHLVVRVPPLPVKRAVPTMPWEPPQDAHRAR